MDLESIVEARIHPAIGIARIGNSDEYFIGPQVPHPTPPPPGGYRDASGKLKRQAAQFRIYGYDSNGEVVTELTCVNAHIEWTVHVANKKGAWYDFDAALDLPEAKDLKSCRRNAFIQGEQREKLVIDPGPRTVSGPNCESARFDTGKFLDSPVYLGELFTDDVGRLGFVGGKGVSASPLNFTLVTFANNPGWHDDTSDGPVRAKVVVNGREIGVAPAWVVTTPPNYSPDLVTPQTIYDVITDALAGSLLNTPTTPSFTKNILPLLRQFDNAQWVNFGFAVQFGWQAPNNFLRPEILAKLAAAPGHGDPYGELRRQIFYSFRNPASTVFEPLAWPPIYGDAFGSYDTPPVARAGFAVTNTLYTYLQQWSAGDFIADYDKTATAPASIGDVPLKDQPAALDLAALHFCMGGPFHPGCEMTWPMRHPSMYSAPYRLRVYPHGLTKSDYGEFLTQTTVNASDGPLSVSGPGDITKWMAVPWQTDTASCRAGYPNTEFPSDPFIPTFWPSRVPNNVITEEQYRTITNPNTSPEERMEAFNTRPYWLRSLDFSKPYVEQITTMISMFGDLGLILKREASVQGLPPFIYVETLPERKKLLAATAPATPDPKKPSVSEEFARARFGGLRRR
ncbi:MAG: LodA/GoxA family CTQ-dependent oxidase [Bryobacteraceae bacterium]